MADYEYALLKASSLDTAFRRDLFHFIRGIDEAA